MGLLVLLSGQAFAFTPVTFTGRAVNVNSTGIGGVTIYLSTPGGTLTQTTDAAGNTTFSNLALGPYAAVASLAGEYSSPVNFDVTLDSPPEMSVEFTFKETSFEDHTLTDDDMAQLSAALIENMKNYYVDIEGLPANPEEPDGSTNLAYRKPVRSILALDSNPANVRPSDNLTDGSYWTVAYPGRFQADYEVDLQGAFDIKQIEIVLKDPRNQMDVYVANWEIIGTESNGFVGTIASGVGATADVLKIPVNRTLTKIRLRANNTDHRIGISELKALGPIPVPPKPQPTVFGVKVLEVTDDSATIGWMTDTLADTRLPYGTTTAYGLSGTRISELSMGHKISIYNLKPGTNYHFKAKSGDKNGVFGFSADQTFTTTGKDVTPPAITNIEVSTTTPSSATITWVTDELSDTRTVYGLSEGTAVGVPIQPALVKQHTVTLTGLVQGRTYYYQVKSADTSGNVGGKTSGFRSFTMP